MTVTTQRETLPHQANPQPIAWPDSVRLYVQRAFVPDNLLPNVTRQEMEAQLKVTITKAAEAGELDSINWATWPLPQEIVQQTRAYAAQSYHRQDWGIAFQPATSQQQSPPGNSKKRSFDDLTTADQANPPWRKGAKGGNSAFEDRITYANKTQATRMEKRLKKTQQTMEPSSKFQADLDKRRQRFELDKSSSQPWSHHDDENENGNGPVVGTSQTVLKSYYRLTSAPRPENVRPQPVLQKALDILKKKWREVSDYNYVCDQLKSIRQDLTVQHIKNQFTVEVYQTHALVALEKGDLGEYNQCQTQLRGLYALKLGGRPAEFMAYRVLYLIHTANRTGMNEILSELTSTDKEEKPIKHALQVRAAVASGNYHKLFMLYHECPNMGPYLMDMFVTRERLSALARICKSYVLFLFVLENNLLTSLTDTRDRISPFVSCQRN
jgi:hypothetical protein